MICSCVITSGIDTVTIGWANVAQFDNLRAWVRQRMARGYKYIIRTEPIARNVVYNNATKIDLGVGAAELEIASREIGEFLASGDISIVRLVGSASFLRMAQTASDVLIHDTIEVPPKNPGLT